MTDVALHQPIASEASSSASYRVVKIIKSGDIISSTKIYADDDKQAIELAMDMIDDHILDLWDGFRFIAHIPPAD